LARLADITGFFFLSILLHELNTRFLFRLFYAPVSISVASSPSCSAYCALVDSGATINLIHKSGVSFLGLTVEPHLGLVATLLVVDRKMALSCSSYVSLSYIVADSNVRRSSWIPV